MPDQESPRGAVRNITAHRRLLACEVLIKIASPATIDQYGTLPSAGLSMPPYRLEFPVAVLLSASVPGAKSAKVHCPRKCAVHFAVEVGKDLFGPDHPVAARFSS
ncbi:Uncharacterised protein [Mycobacteroides abscessus subsp. abscessus]|nr:Uncharacterised protein [Mycobacteroides abscessus subsp. abscessus]